MIEVSELKFSYNKKTELIKNLNFSVNEGEVCSLLGANGAGKTTIIKLILGLLKQEKGKVSINGLNSNGDNISYKKMIGYVSDAHDIYDSLTAKEFLNFMADAYGVSAYDRNEFYPAMLKRFNMDDVMNNPIKSFSHGMKQKIAIIGSLVHDPYLWILDEPMNGLDVESVSLVKQLISERAKKGKVVIFSSHIMEICEKLSDRIIIIKNGDKVMDKPISELTHASLEKTFLGVIQDE